MLAGYKTFAVGLVIAVGPALLQYLGAVDWTQLGVSVPTATAVTGVITMLMRLVTNTAPFQGK